MLFFLFLSLCKGQDFDNLKSTDSRLFYNEQTSSIVGFICTWEDGWCDGWQNIDFSQTKDYVPSKYFDFVVRKGASASPATGPAFDHTVKNQDGHYLLLEASKKRFLSRCEIFSPPIDLSAFPEYCFSMWYLMFGRHTFSLHVYISIPSTRTDREMVFKASGSASKTATHWLFTQATIRRPKNWEAGKMANITIAGIRGLSYQADIGLDDIKITPGKCPDTTPLDATPPPTTTTTTTTRNTKVTTTTQKANAMVTREWNPFYDLKVERCEVKTPTSNTIMEQYIINTHMCCGNEIKSRLNGSKCCNGQQYFARKQACCNNEIIDTTQHQCCGGQKMEYDKENRCCNGESRPKSTTEGCCGDLEFFNKETQGCCINAVYSKETEYCCGGSVILKSDETTLCCGEGWQGEEYKAGREACCNGNLFYVTKYGCCADKFVFNKEWEMCNKEDIDHPKVNFKLGKSWKKPQHRAGQYLFTYRRKRRDVETMTHSESMNYYNYLRSHYVDTKYPFY